VQSYDFKPLSEGKAKLLNPMSLAFVGDCVQTLYVRTRLAIDGDARLGALHNMAADIINATNQAAAFQSKIGGVLTEKEADIFRRARNNKNGTVAKHASVIDYKIATGLEAVIGYLYLTGQDGRLHTILKLCCEKF
jgi:ribonuclease-3 family protein